MPVRTRPLTRERAAHLGPERRRPQVLDAARDLALRDGLGAVTFGALAAEMGVTRPVLYACFRDRVELLTALLDREESALIESVLGALHSTAALTDPEEAFVAGFTALFEVAAEHSDAWRLLLGGQPDPALMHRLEEARRVVQKQTTSWIRPAMELWWQPTDLDRKLPVLIDLFMATCESGIRTLLDPANDWQTSDLGAFLGRAMFRAFETA